MCGRVRMFFNQPVLCTQAKLVHRAIRHFKRTVPFDFHKPLNMKVKDTGICPKMHLRLRHQVTVSSYDERNLFVPYYNNYSYVKM